MLLYVCDACGVRVEDLNILRVFKFPMHISSEPGDYKGGYVVQVKNWNGALVTQPTSGNYIDKHLCIICDNRVNQVAFDMFNKIKDEHK